MAKVDLKKTVFNKAQFDKVTGGRDFTFFVDDTPLSGLTVQDFFDLYENLFLTIPIDGPENSHEYLVRRSGELVGFQRTTDDLQPLLDEISSLRQQLLTSRQENIQLQIDAAGGNTAGQLTQQFAEILETLSEQEEQDIVIQNILPTGSESRNSFTLTEDSIRAVVLGTGEARSVQVSVFENDEIPEGTTLTFLGKASEPQYGSAVVTNVSTGTITYTPNLDAPSGTRVDSFTYRVKNEKGVENTGIVYVDIENILATNKPPIANTDVIIVSIDEDGTVNSNSVNLLENDVDPDSDQPLFFDGIVDSPNFGELVFLDEDAGIVQYIPNKRAPSGQKADQFTYKVVDTLGGSATGTVFVNIDNKFLLLTEAGDDVISITFEVSDTTNPNNNYTVSGNVKDLLENDRGLDLAFNSITRPPSSGSLTVDENNGIVTYTPRVGVRGDEIDLGAFFTFGAGRNSDFIDTFEYKVDNLNNARTDTATVTVKFNAVA